MWNKNRVQNMTLEDYHKAGAKEKCFAYWIETGLDGLGGIRGGESIKYGIYNKSNINSDKLRESDLLCDGDGYVWYRRYGDTKEKAFDTIKNAILKLIECVQNNKINEIDSIDCGWKTYKWKIAFCYQDINDPKIIPIYKEEVLRKITKEEFKLDVRKIKIGQMQELIFGKKPSNQDIFEFSDPLWEKYGIKKTDEKPENGLSSDEKSTNYFLNQILYGPPGTGKTYHTIDKALGILNYDDEKIKIELEGLEIDISNDDRENKKSLFDYLTKQGQIKFITFHQNYGYEEFIEGIKPIIDEPIRDSEGKEIREGIKYKVQDGVFKRICREARDNYRENNKQDKGFIYSDLYLDNLIRDFMQDLQSKLDNNHPSYVDEFPIEIIYSNLDDIVFGGSNRWFTSQILKRDYQDFRNGYIKEPSDVKRLIKNDRHPYGKDYLVLYKKLREFEEKHLDRYSKIESGGLKSYVLIIDEINRGNISKIFGELITLIEPSKRLGEPEELSLTLPYSGESFGVPKNLYIIGTMNTADRSIALMDTALRRRFHFVEMMPDGRELAKILKDDENKDIDINLQEMLEAMNNRIEFLYDREHTIGHAFFIDVKTLDELKRVFQNKIIPLLQEYFYEDYAKINAVLNGNGMIEKKTIKPVDIFSQNIGIKDLDLEDKPKYKIADFENKDKEIWGNPLAYQKIYKNTDNKTKENDQSK